MLEYIIKRIILAIISIFIIITITFFLMNAIPGGPFDSEKAITPQVKQILEERYHLNDPLTTQYLNYLKNILHGDFGISIKTGKNVIQVIKDNFKISASIGIYAMIIAIICGIILGCLSAFNKGNFFDNSVIFLSTLFVSIPSFILASVLLFIFAVKLQLIPVWSAAETSYILPIIALAVYPTSNIIKYTRASMIDALSQDYIRTAIAKGLPKPIIIYKHALRNALIPVITYIGPMFAAILTGSFVIESIFSIGGLGTEFITSINTRDYSMIMGTTIFLASLIIIISLISDLLYKIVDPRIKF